MAPRLLPPLAIEPRVNQYTERTEGLHLSQIILDLLIGLEPGKYAKQTHENVRWMNFLAGLIFERVLEEAWLSKEFQHRPELVRPGEIKLDGILMTPDAYDTVKRRPEEYKCTKKSCRQSVLDKKFWPYWVQLKAYAYALKTIGYGTNSGALYILHINGNYSRDDDDPDSGYVIKPWEDEWSDLQLEENWAMIVQHARNRGWL
jgi:hypothetical protein